MSYTFAAAVRCICLSDSALGEASLFIARGCQRQRQSLGRHRHSTLRLRFHLQR